jgi:hypothetical protein
MIRRISAAVFLFLVAVSPQTSAKSAEGPTQTAYSTSDVAQLVQVVIGIPTNHAFLMALEISPAAKLPAWDPVAHYSGPQNLQDGRTAYFVLVNEKYAAALHDVAHADHSVAAAIASAVFLAAMDGGIAGTKWKSLYDVAAAADAQLPSDATDQYANRHALANHLADTQTTVYPNLGDAPIGDAAGYPLTEKLAYGSDSLGLARLGVGAARILELSENGDAMKEQAAQDFEDDWFASFRSILPTDDGRLELDGLRQFLRPDTPSSHVGDQDHFVAGVIKLVNALPSDTRAPFFVGLQVSETRYNATVIRHVDEDSALRAGLAKSPSLDSTLPALASLRDRLAAAPSGDWATITSISNQIIKSIIDGH